MHPQYSSLSLIAMDSKSLGKASGNLEWNVAKVDLFDGSLWLAGLGSFAFDGHSFGDLASGLNVIESKQGSQAIDLSYPLFVIASPVENA